MIPVTDDSAPTPSNRDRIAMVAYTHYQTDPRCRREATLAAQAGWDVHFYALSQDGSARTGRPSVSGPRKVTTAVPRP